MKKMSLEHGLSTNQWLKSYFLKAFLFIFSFWCLGCGQASQESKIPKLIIAIDATFVPMSFLNDQGELDGFEVDLIKAVAKNARFNYEMVNVEWGDCLVA